MLDAFARWVQDVVFQVGYPGLFALIVLESTLIPIPSELVMPFAGHLAAQGKFSLAAILAINSIAAMTGSGISYWIGAAGGRPLLVKYGKFAGVRAKDLDRTEAFFGRHGKATILIGRFLPVVRHIISVPAGVARMPLVPFFTQTFIGSTIWGTVLIFIGYELGDRFASVALELKHVDLLVGAGIIVVLLALAVRFVVRRRRAVAGTATSQPAD
ncbi:MAG TPA: DedA family protein [Kofleriaceae bacterium]|jgi:membrane protein DedA with SNARE-associated domain|nr:DedA family protein [Kofleriaceae bacterium]